MITTIDEIKTIYKNNPDDIKELKYDIDMMALSLSGGTAEDFITYGNYKKVFKEYMEN